MKKYLCIEGTIEIPKHLICPPIQYDPKWKMPTTKIEADAYDKMLDIAESLELMLEKVDVPLSEQQIESLALEIAKSKDDFMAVLKGAKDPVPAKVSEKSKKTDNVASIKNSDEKQVS